MIERTAAGIESCGLQRVLGKPTRSTKRHRQLYQGFWQHGASAIELGSAWPASTHVTENPTADTDGTPQHASLAASAFFFDFLYPNATPASLRRIYPSLPRSQDNASSSTAARRRHFMSSRSVANDDEPKPASESPAPRRSLKALMRQERINEAKASKGNNPDDGLPAGSFDSAEPTFAKPSTEDIDPAPTRSPEGMTQQNSRSEPETSTTEDPDDDLGTDLLDSQEPTSTGPSSQDIKPTPTRSPEDMMRLRRRNEPKFSMTDDPEDGLSADLFDAPERVPLGTSIREIARRAELDARQIIDRRHRPKLSDLPDLLSRPEDETYHDIWDLYCRIEEEDQKTFRAEVVLYLSQSHSIVEIGRCMSLLPRITVDEWSEEYIAAAVLTYMRSADLPQAIRQFKLGLGANGLSGGLEHLLSDSITKQNWETVVDVWMAYYKACMDTETTDVSRLDQLNTLSNLGRLYISFEKWIAEHIGNITSGLVGTLRSPGLALFRRKFAEMTLEQGCPPRQADIILQSLDNHQLYHDYILRMITSWREKEEIRANLTMIPDIYNRYRQLAGFKPSVDLLRAMFDLYFPHDATGLENLFNDWHNIWGDLDQWGYEKFLKWYATAGDVEAVETLWKRYVERFPAVLERPEAFAYTMNVYAQTGNIARAEEEMLKMDEEYGLRPTTSIWTMMLKCYVRADDYDLALECFEQIRTISKPDSFTYAHIMAMASKKGDLEATIDFFNEAQSTGIPVSNEMVLALVTVYCQNDKVDEAEAICTELAGRKITTCESWNMLLRTHGKQGKLDKCYELLQSMKAFEIQWDNNTYEALFIAMVEVNQIGDAYNLLKRAFKDRLFHASPEHYATVMMGAVHAGEAGLVHAIRTSMVQAGQPMNFNSQVAFALGAFELAPHAPATRELACGLVDALRSVGSYNRAYKWGAGKRSGTSVASVSWDARRMARQTSTVGEALKLLVELREFNTMEELINVYLGLFPGRKEEDAFPQYVVAPLLEAHLAQGNSDKVHEMWDQNWDRVLASHTQPQGGIYPASQYVLNRTVDVMARFFREEGDGEGLLACIRTVIDSGFKLSSGNWNKVVSYLSELGQWDAAMEWCEELLMPQWRGWKAGRLKSEEKNSLRNTRRLVPTTFTVLKLQQQWLEQRKLAAWSGDVSVRLSATEQSCPRLYHAFQTSEFEENQAQWVLQGKVSVKQSIDTLLRNLPASELRDMAKVLRRQMYREDQKDPDREQLNPFHVTEVDPAAGKKTKPLTRHTLHQLREAVRRKLELVRRGTNTGDIGSTKLAREINKLVTEASINRPIRNVQAGLSVDADDPSKSPQAEVSEAQAAADAERKAQIAFEEKLAKLRRQMDESSEGLSTLNLEEDQRRALEKLDMKLERQLRKQVKKGTRRRPLVKPAVRWMPWMKLSDVEDLDVNDRR